MVSSNNPLSVKAFDLFCSVGGLTYGLRHAGLNVVGGLDIDESCRYAYENNCGSTFIHSDIRSIGYDSISEHFDGANYRVLVGCAPCQPFSSHTKKFSYDSADPRWSLINDFLRIALEGKPEIVSMENVPQLRNQSIYGEFKRKLSDVGYKISDGIICCSKFGVPQRRRRLILLASLLGEIDLPKPKSNSLKTVRDIIGNLAPIENGEASGDDPLHVCSRLDPINLERIRVSLPGGSWRSWPDSLLPACYKKDSGQTYGSVYGRMVWDSVAPTITTQFYRFGTGRFGHPEQDRALSLREGALLQTFPERYAFIKPNDSVLLRRIGRHIGNAVPPLLAAAIGESILEHVNSFAKVHV